MTQDQYGQSGGSGYGVRDDAVPSDEADDSQGKPMTRFQKVASALLGDRPERDETATDRAATDESAAEGDMPTNPDVPPADTSWATHPGDAATATATPDSSDGLDAQYPADSTAGDSTAGTTASSGTPADARSQRDYWDDPAGSAAGAGPAAPTFTPASEAGAAEPGDQPGAATIADVPAAGASAREDGVTTDRDAAGIPETAVVPETAAVSETAASPAAVESSAAAGSPAAQGTPAVAGTTTVAGATGIDAPVTDAPVTGTSVTDAAVTDAPVTDAPVAGSAGADPAAAGVAGTAPGTGAAGTTAGGPAANDLRPGEAAGKLGDFSDLTFGSLIPDAAAYTDQWQQVQFRFVDDPRGSVTEAAEIVKQVTAKLETGIQERLRAIQERQAAISEQQKSLDARWGEGSNADTETLRETLRMYKAFLDQLVGPKA